MKQEIGENNGVVSQGGRVYVCQGGGTCALDSGEDERQKRFEQNTGMSCCKGERQALDHLMEQHHFERKQLQLAKRMGSLYWNYKTNRLCVVVSRVELVGGIALVILGAAMVAAFMLPLLIERPALPLLEFAKFLVVIFFFFAMIPVAEKYMIRPNRIASRALPLIDNYYSSGREQ